MAGAFTGVRGRGGSPTTRGTSSRRPCYRRRRAWAHGRAARRAAGRGEGPGHQGSRRAARRPQGRHEGAAGRRDRSLRFDGAEAGAPNVWLFVGVNGVGKTTTIGKVAAQQQADGRTVVMAAGDTFRAAAAEQLQTWAERAGADFVRGAEGGDPSAVIFDAVAAGRRPGRRPGAGRHRRAAAHQDQPHGGAAQGAPGGRSRARQRHRGAAGASTPPPARTASPRPASSPRPSTSPAWCSPSSTARPRAASCSPSSTSWGSR